MIGANEARSRPDRNHPSHASWFTFQLSLAHPLFAFRTEVGVLLPVLEHHAHLIRARKEVVVGFGRDLNHLECVPLLVERANDVVPRVQATAHVEGAAMG